MKYLDKILGAFIIILLSVGVLIWVVNSSRGEGQPICTDVKSFVEINKKDILTYGDYAVLNKAYTDEVYEYIQAVVPSALGVKKKNDFKNAVIFKSVTKPIQFAWFIYYEGKDGCDYVWQVVTKSNLLLDKYNSMDVEWIRKQEDA